MAAIDSLTGKLAGEGPGVTAMDPFTGKLAVVIGGGSGMGRGAGGPRAG
ncbi:MAG TPA: hypothetical protein VJ371_19215 [Streptosporangiaceae bacterium]|nr:hypothetical protein [Streptosporangiaceae bacterium]